MNAEATRLADRWAQIKAYHDEHGWSRHLAPHRDLLERIYVEGHRAQVSKKLGADELALLDEALVCSYSEVWADGVSDLIQALYPFGRNQINAWVQRNMCSKKALIRWHTVQISGAIGDEGVRDGLLRSGLRDKSARVREFAADRIVSSLNKRLLPEFRESAQHFNGTEEGNRLANDLKLIEDGYIARHDPSTDRIELTVQLPGQLIMTSMSRRDFERKGAERAVAQVVKEYR